MSTGAPRAIELEHLGLAVGQQGDAAAAEGAEEGVGGEAHQAQDLVGRRRLVGAPGEAEHADQLAAVAEPDPQHALVLGVRPAPARWPRAGWWRGPRDEDVAGPLEAGGQPAEAGDVDPLAPHPRGRGPAPGPLVRHPQRGRRRARARR